jgi:hypothetical protein
VAIAAVNAVDGEFAHLSDDDIDGDGKVEVTPLQAELAEMTLKLRDQRRRFADFGFRKRQMQADVTMQRTQLQEQIDAEQIGLAADRERLRLLDERLTRLPGGRAPGVEAQPSAAALHAEPSAQPTWMFAAPQQDDDSARQWMAMPERRSIMNEERAQSRAAANTPRHSIMRMSSQSSLQPHLSRPASGLGPVSALSSSVSASSTSSQEQRAKSRLSQLQMATPSANNGRPPLGRPKSALVGSTRSKPLVEKFPSAPITVAQAAIANAADLFDKGGLDNLIAERTVRKRIDELDTASINNALSRVELKPPTISDGSELFQAKTTTVATKGEGEPVYVYPFVKIIGDESMMFAEALRTIHTWDGFDIFQIPVITNGWPLCFVFSVLFHHSGLAEELRDNLDPLVAARYIQVGSITHVASVHHYVSCLCYQTLTHYSFLRSSPCQAIESRYLANPYHTSTHAADVLHAAYHFVHNSPLRAKMTPMETWCLLVSAAVHDVGHPGVNNAFVISSKSSLAMWYNDKSVLENYHTALAFMLMQNSEFDVLRKFPTGQRAQMRSLIIDLVMVTDLAEHFEHCGQITRANQVGSITPVSGNHHLPGLCYQTLTYLPFYLFSFSSLTRQSVGWTSTTQSKSGWR